MTRTLPNVVYEDDFIIAVSKPSGMLVHRGWGCDGVILTDVVRDFVGTAKAFLMHRLDRGTSGVVLFAKDSDTAKTMMAKFQCREVKKKYLALVRGVPPPAGTVDHPLQKRDDGPRVEAVTDFRLLQTVESEPRYVSLVEACPKTGRLHQVRKHLKHISHPVIGDANYGKGSLNREIAQRYGLRRLALHAFSLTFKHPSNAKSITLTDCLPWDLVEPLLEMGFSAGLLRNFRKEGILIDESADSRRLHSQIDIGYEKQTE